MKSNLRIIMMGSAHLIANSLAIFGISTNAHAALDAVSVKAKTQSPTSTQINAVSISSIEKSFLAVPGICKARNAAFNPVNVGNEEISNSKPNTQTARAICSSLDSNLLRNWRL